METEGNPAGGKKKAWLAWYERAVLVRNQDPVTERRGRLLAGILLGSLLPLLVISIINFIQIFTDPGQGYASYLVEDVAVIAALVGLYWLNRTGRAWLAACIFLILLTLVITVMDPLNTLDRILLAYVIPIAVASFLIGPVFSFLFALLAAAGYTGVYLTGQAAFSFNYLSMVALFVFALVSALTAGQMESLLRETRLALKSEQAAQSALRASEDKFKYVFDYSVIGKSITLPSGEMEVNQAFCEMLGYSREELINHKWQEITHPDDVELTQNVITSLLSGEKEAARFTKRYLHKNGSIVWADIGTALRRAQDGQPLYLMTSINDITERKQAEEAQQQNELLFRAIFELSPDAVVLIDPHDPIVSWPIVDCNAVACLMNGYRRDEMIGHSIDILNTTPGTQAERIAYMKQLREIGNLKLETQHRQKSGAIFPVEVSTTLIKVGERELVMGIDRDITERKQAEDILHENEQRLASIYDTVGDVIFYLDVEPDEQYRFSSVNPAFGNVTGLPSGQVIGRKVNEIIPEPSLTMVLGKYRQAIQEKTIVRWEETSDYPTGRLIGEVSVAPVFDDIGNCTHLVGAVHEITERKQAEEEIRHLNAELEQRVIERTAQLEDAQEQLVRQEKLAVMGQLAGGVGHELRNPLAVIINAIYYLKLVQPEADEKIQKYHGMIEHEVHNAEKIINDLLDFARVKSVDRETVAVPELVQRVLERFPVPESITTVLVLPADLPMVYADPRQMEQLLGNLAVNACQAMSEGGKLTISASQQEELVAIEVKDTGMGIAPENMQKLFEPLFTTKAKRIGLGLAVSKKLAEANDGRIEVQSEPGKGSTFTLHLPVKP